MTQFFEQRDGVGNGLALFGAEAELNQAYFDVSLDLLNRPDGPLGPGEPEIYCSESQPCVDWMYYCTACCAEKRWETVETGLLGEGDFDDADTLEAPAQESKAESDTEPPPAKRTKTEGKEY